MMSKRVFAALLVAAGAAALLLGGVARAGELYAKQCAMCHGKDGKGSKMCEKDITGLGEDAITKALVGKDKPKQHKKDLTDAELKEALAAVKGMGKSCPGAEAYGKQCAMCHGKDGKGSKMCEKDITGLDKAAIIKAIAGEERSKSHKNPVEEGLAKQIAMHVKSLGAKSCGLAGAELYAKNCAMCHGKDGKGSKMCEKDVTGLDEAAIVKALVGDGKPKQHKKPVTEPEAKDIAAYMQGLSK